MTNPLLIDVPEEIRGPRVLVRPFGPEDAAQMWEAVEESRDHLGPWLPWVHDYRSPDDARAFVIRARAQWLLRQDFNLGVFEHGGRLLGGVALHPRNWDIRYFEIGYWIRRTATGQGYVTEAVQLVTRLAFETLRANRVEIRTDTRNVHSSAVAERLGFVLEGTLRRSATDGQGRPKDMHVFALIPSDYERLEWAQEKR